MQTLPPTTAAKFWVSCLAGGNAFIHTLWGIDLGLDAETSLQIVTGVSMLSSFLVWAVPNKPKD